MKLRPLAQAKPKTCRRPDTMQHDSTIQQSSLQTDSNWPARKQQAGDVTHLGRGGDGSLYSCKEHCRRLRCRLNAPEQVWMHWALILCWQGTKGDKKEEGKKETIEFYGGLVN